MSATWELCRREGNAFYAANRYRDAIAAYSRAIQHNSAESKLFSNRGLCHMKLGDATSCAMDADRALELDAKNSKAWYLKGRCQYHCGNYSTAARSFKRGLDQCCLVPDAALSHALYHDLFNAYFVANREASREAEQARNHAIRQSVDHCKAILSDRATDRFHAADASSILEQLYHMVIDRSHEITVSPTAPERPRPASRIELPECFLCPISLDVMRDPVIFRNQGSGFQTYDRASLARHFELSAKDPITSDIIQDWRQLVVPNIALRNAITTFLECHPELYTGSLDSFHSV